jgi:hypothetical protein
VPRICGLILGLAAAAGAEEPDLKVLAVSSVANYQIRTSGETPRDLKLLTEPVIRFTTNSIDEGDVFLWTDAGRPAAAAQVFQLETEPGQHIWLHEFQSLAAGPLTLADDAQTLWSPASRGAEWKTLPADALPPASRPLRFTQMKQLARRFSATEQTPGLARGDEYLPFEMELKPREVYRYESPEQGVVDGAVFWLAKIGESDPELLLLIEAAKDEQGTMNWRYAAAPLSCWPMQLRLDEATVQDIPNRFLASKTDDPYHIWHWTPPAP